MHFRSTKSKSPLVSYKEAVLKCLPPDGGLYIPDQAADFRQFFLHMNEKTSFNELVAAITPLFFGDSVNPVSALNIARSAYNFEPELLKLDDDFSLLNLCSGPTGVFKDFGIAFMSAVLEEILKKDEQVMIISAANPDTGLSMANAFSGRKGITLVLLYAPSGRAREVGFTGSHSAADVYPSGQIYGLDPSVFVQNGGNIIPIQVKGTFDDCQRLVIETILDRDFSERYKVTSANSINPGRLFPHIFYYLYTFIQIKNRLSGDFIFSVPCGNFSNLTAGLYAWKFGMPVNGFIAAMNVNNSLGDYIRGKPFVPSLPINTNSPALDVSVPINYERLASFCEEAPAVMRNMVHPVCIDDNLTLKTIEFVRKKYNTLIDPHTAVAFAAAQQFKDRKEKNDHAHTIILATGHPARFALQKKCDPVAIISPQLDAFENAVAACF